LSEQGIKIKCDGRQAQTDEKRSNAADTHKEAAMAYATDHLQFTRYYDPAAREAGHHGVLRRIADALIQWRQRKADRDIAAYIQRSGGHITDSVERELMERVSRSALGEWQR
jgi:hypothetical protein